MGGKGRGGGGGKERGAQWDSKGWNGRIFPGGGALWWVVEILPLPGCLKYYPLVITPMGRPFV